MLIKRIRRGGNSTELFTHDHKQLKYLITMIDKREISKIKVHCTIGFIYWLKETNDMRGLKSLSILDFPAKLEELKKEYDKKYPDGLTGW